MDVGYVGSTNIVLIIVKTDTLVHTATRIAEVLSLIII